MPFKLYVDSRFRVQTGGESSDADFTINLPHPVQVKGRAFVDTCLIPNSFFVIRSGENDRFHVREIDSGVVHYHTLTIPPRQYNAVTLATAIDTVLDTASNFPGTYTVVFNAQTSRLEISCTGSTTFQVFPDEMLKADPNSWNVGAFANGDALIDANNLRGAGSVTGFSRGTAYISGSSSVKATALDSVNCIPYHQMFLRSDLATGYDAIGPDGSSDIIRRITCQVGLNDIIIDQHALPNDTVSIGSRELTSLRFRLTDVFGKTLDTNGFHISFSIIFVEDE